MQHFQNILDYNFTANVEKEFDEIAQGDVVWNKMIKDFYGSFHAKVIETTKTSEKFSGERLLGVDPTTGKNVFVKIGRYGAVVQIGETDNTEKPKFAGLQKGQSIETITLNEAMELFKLPRVAGTFEDAEMTIAIGRFGPYIRHNSSFYSISKADDPYTISQERAVEIILEKRDKDSKKLIREFKENPEVKVLNGRWGAYIAIGKNNFRIPKGTEAETLTLDVCLKIAEGTGNPKQEKIKKEAKPKTAAKKPAKKTAAKTKK